MKLPRSAWEGIRLGFPINQPPDSGTRADQDRAVIGFSETLDTIHLARHRMKFWWTGFPSPEPVGHARPEITLAVLIQTSRALAETAVLSIAPDGAIVNRAEPPYRKRPTASPHRPFMILKELEN